MVSLYEEYRLCHLNDLKKYLKGKLAYYQKHSCMKHRLAGAQTYAPLLASTVKELEELRAKQKLLVPLKRKRLVVNK